jgi:hypothetical protein
MTSTLIVIDHSAASKRAEIFEAVDQLNAEIGDEVFVAVELAPGEIIEGAAVVRLVDRLDGKETIAGRTVHWRHDLEILIEPTTKPRFIAHELCHAAGLAHTADEGNLMFYAPQRLALADDQREYLRGLARLASSLETKQNENLEAQ